MQNSRWGAQSPRIKYIPFNRLLGIKQSKTPVNRQSKTPQRQRAFSTKRLSHVPVPPVDPLMLDLNNDELYRIKKHIKSNSKHTQSQRKLRSNSRLDLRSKKDELSNNLNTMAQVRKALITEVTQNNIHELTREKLDEIRYKSLKRIEMQSDESASQIVKHKRELMSRSPLNNGIYALAALPGRMRRAVNGNLASILPDVSRFRTIR